MKTVVITGSSKGIGLGMAKEFLKRGCNVVMSSYAPEEMAAEFIKAQAEFGEDKVAAQACDVTDIDQLRALWDVASEKFGPVDIWMNNAG
ncbi:MAG: SDR family oxidoreductase, partial [Deltaproteobacteria bacterium]|nr:SDR family oxidoreductase [Deltaproteobacteria bacterium]